MQIEVAQDRRIQAFRQRFGDGHFYLACHAALPLALTPDLLYRLWATFQRDCQDHDLAMPWIAVSDLLLSGLCAEVGHELYEMEPAVRDELMQQLKASPRLGPMRLRELAEFMIAYSAPQLESADLDTRDFAQAQQWRALAYQNPQAAAQTIATTLAGLSFADTHEWIRLATLVETLEEPLAEFPGLLGYVGAIGNFARGDERSATAKLNQILDANYQIEVADVNLLIPDVINGKLLKTSEPDVPFVARPNRLLWPIAIAGSAIASILIIVGVQYGLRSPDPQRTPDVTSSLPPSPQISPSVSPQLQKTPSPSSTRTVPSTPPSSTPRPIASPSSSPSPAQPNPDLGSDGSLSHATIIEILDGDQVYINDTKVRVHAIARAG